MEEEEEAYKLIISVINTKIETKLGANQRSPILSLSLSLLPESRPGKLNDEETKEKMLKMRQS